MAAAPSDVLPDEILDAELRRKLARLVRRHPRLNPWIMSCNFFVSRVFSHVLFDRYTICANCTVRQDCLEMVIVLEDTDDRWGVFGGLTPPQRAKLRKELKEMLR